MDQPALLPAEAYVMLEPSKRRGKETLKVALMALLAQRVVQFVEVERKVLGFRAKHPVLVAAPNLPFNLPPAVRAIVDIVHAIQPDGRMETFVQKAQRAFGAGFGKYETEVVLPQLAARGLVSERIEPFLIMFKRKVWYATPQGDQIRRDLEGKLAQARQLPRMFDENPRQAAAMVVALGALVLLAPELKGYYGHIAQAMRPHADGTDSGNWPYDSASHSSGSTERTVIEPDGAPPAQSAPFDAATLGSFDAASVADFSALDFSALDMAAFDTLDTSMSAFDSSFDSAASSSDSGGDSGGGDGGGGGGD